MENEEGNKQGYGKGRPVWQWVLIYLVVAVAIYGVVYYFFLAKKGGVSYNQNQNQTAQSQNQSPSPTAQNPSPTSASTVPQTMQKISVTGSEFAFSPSAITLKKGQLVELTFKNNGTFPHNLSITDLNVKTKTIQPGQTDTVQFTPDKTGEFQFLCTVPGHADKGMTGTITVQ